MSQMLAAARRMAARKLRAVFVVASGDGVEELELAKGKPGALILTEVMSAHKAGTDFVKGFPPAPQPFPASCRVVRHGSPASPQANSAGPLSCSAYARTLLVRNTLLLMGCL
jgi:hypothetical protein